MRWGAHWCRPSSRHPVGGHAAGADEVVEALASAALYRGCEKSPDAIDFLPSRCSVAPSFIKARRRRTRSPFRGPRVGVLTSAAFLGVNMQGLVNTVTGLVAVLASAAPLRGLVGYRQPMAVEIRSRCSLVPPFIEARRRMPPALLASMSRRLLAPPFIMASRTAGWEGRDQGVASLASAASIEASLSGRPATSRACSRRSRAWALRRGPMRS